MKLFFSAACRARNCSGVLIASTAARRASKCFWHSARRCRSSILPGSVAGSRTRRSSCARQSSQRIMRPPYSLRRREGRRVRPDSALAGEELKDQAEGQEEPAGEHEQKGDLEGAPVLQGMKDRVERVDEAQAAAPPVLPVQVPLGREPADRPHEDARHEDEDRKRL